MLCGSSILVCVPDLSLQRRRRTNSACLLSICLRSVYLLFYCCIHITLAGLCCRKKSVLSRFKNSERSAPLSILKSRGCNMYTCLSLMCRTTPFPRNSIFCVSLSVYTGCSLASGSLTDKFLSLNLCPVIPRFNEVGLYFARYWGH